MTAKELIEKLKELPPNAVVLEEYTHEIDGTSYWEPSIQRYDGPDLMRSSFKDSWTPYEFDAKIPKETLVALDIYII